MRPETSPVLSDVGFRSVDASRRDRPTAGPFATSSSHRLPSSRDNWEQQSPGRSRRQTEAPSSGERPGPGPTQDWGRNESAQYHGYPSVEGQSSHRSPKLEPQSPYTNWQGQAYTALPPRLPPPPQQYHQTWPIHPLTVVRISTTGDTVISIGSHTHTSPTIRTTIREHRGIPRFTNHGQASIQFTATATTTITTTSSSSSSPPSN